MIQKNRMLIFYIGLLCVLSLGLISCFNTKVPSQVKQEQWQAMAKEIDSITDQLGLKIDPGIKKTVIALNLLGFKTSQSCEGHINHGLPYPWIDFAETKEIIKLKKKRQNVFMRIQKERSDIQKKYPNISLEEALKKEESKELNALYQEAHMINNEIEKTSKFQMMPLNTLLDNFYKNYYVNHDRIIAINELSPTFFRMYSLGGNWQITRSNQEQEAKLNEYQQEMKKFTEFLTNTYFNN